MDEFITQGTCNYCGQTLTVENCQSQEEADSKATEQCKCDEAQQDSRKTKTIEDAKADIEDLFGDGAENRGESSLELEDRELLFAIAQRVYADTWRSVVIKIDQATKAKISVTDKGKLTIQRDDSYTRKREHK